MSGSLDLGLTWREVGGDSLGLMRLSLALERSLGRKLTFDQLDPDMTATQLARILVQQTIAVPESNTARVHLIPGILGATRRSAISGDLSSVCGPRSSSCPI